jgi:hypothetical protein
MNRRKYIAALGSVAAGSAFAIGSSASIDIWADRETSIDVVRDTDGLISFSTEGSENSQFATTDGGTLGIDLSRARDAEGVNVGARTTIDDIFRIRNQAGSDQVVWIKDTTDDGTDLLGDEGPLHFFRGPLRITDDSGNGVVGARRRVFSQIAPVPGTPGDEQRLTITGLVPAQANIGPNPTDDQRKAWINEGHPVTDVNNGEPVISDSERTNRDTAAGTLSGVRSNNVVVGNSQGRYFLEPGEEMVVGIDADFRGFSLDGDDDLVGPDGTSYTDPLPDEIQIVSRGPDDARNLATGDTEFNTVPGPDEE